MDIDLSGYVKYFIQLIQIPPVQNLQDQIKSFKSRNTAQVSFHAAMKRPIDFFWCIIKKMKLCS